MGESRDTLSNSESEEYQTTESDHDDDYKYGNKKKRYKHVHRHSDVDDEDDVSAMYLDVESVEYDNYKRGKHTCLHHRKARKVSLSSLIPSLPDGDDDVSETSVQRDKSMDDAIVLHHAMELMKVIPDPPKPKYNLNVINNENKIKENSNSVSVIV